MVLGAVRTEVCGLLCGHVPYFPTNHKAVFQTLYRACGAIYICIGNDVFRSRHGRIVWHRRATRRLHCRTRLQPIHSTLLVAHEPHRVCGQRFVHTLFPGGSRHDGQPRTALQPDGRRGCGGNHCVGKHIEQVAGFVDSPQALGLQPRTGTCDVRIIRSTCSRSHRDGDGGYEPGGRRGNRRYIDAKRCARRCGGDDSHLVHHQFNSHRPRCTPHEAATRRQPRPWNRQADRRREDTCIAQRHIANTQHNTDGYHDAQPTTQPRAHLPQCSQRQRLHRPFGTSEPRGAQPG